MSLYLCLCFSQESYSPPFSFFFLFYFYFYFFYDSHRMRERERETEAETQAEREAGSMHREPDMGFDSGSPGWRPGPKAGAKPLRHPGIPVRVFLPELHWLVTHNYVRYLSLDMI